MKKNNNRIKIVFMGTPEFAVPTLKKLINSDNFQIIAVFTQPDKKSERGGKNIIYSPVKKVALENNIPLHQPKKLDKSAAEIIRKLKADIILVAAYGKLLPKNILNIPKHKCINIHASLLPKYRGPSPIQYVILKNEKKTGITIMLMSEKMDEGDIIAQYEVNIYNEETASTLHDKLSKLSGEKIEEVLIKWIDGKIKPLPQQNNKATYTNILKRFDGRVKWNSYAEEIERKFRAFYPWPGTYTFVKINSDIRRLKIFKMNEIETPGIYKSRKPGYIFKDNNKLCVKSAKNSLELLQLQLEGKNKMTGKEFLIGNNIVGSIMK